MKQLTSIEIHYLINEFKELINSKVDKIYHPAKKELLIQFYISGKGKKILRILPSLIYLTEQKGSYEKPSGFCMFLRKRLEGSRLRQIKQIGSERIIEFLFEKKDGKYYLLIELFSKGNVVLCDNNKKIVAVVEKQKWKDRTVDVGEKYKYPKREYDFFKIKESDLVKLFKKSDKESVVKALAIELGFGGVYSEELCSLSKINKNKKPGELKKDDIKALFSNIKKIINKQEKNISEKIEKNIEKVKKPTESKEHKKINNIIKKQKERIEAVKREIEENNKKAELIYQKYQLIDEILKEIKKARKKYSWKEIEEKIKGNKIVKHINEKDKTIVIDIK